MSSPVLAWVLAASATLAPARPHERLATAIATRVEAEAPLFKGDDERRKTSALLVAMAFRESSLRADAVGDMVAGKPTSFCAFQLHLPFGAKSAEGWTGADLVEDPAKCITVAMRMVRDSMRACPAHPLAVYASGPTGCTSERAQRISRDRLAIAQRLLRDVRVPPSVPAATPAGGGAEPPSPAPPSSPEPAAPPAPAREPERGASGRRRRGAARRGRRRPPVPLRV